MPHHHPPGAFRRTRAAQRRGSGSAQAQDAMARRHHTPGDLSAGVSRSGWRRGCRGRACTSSGSTACWHRTPGCALGWCRRWQPRRRHRPPQPLRPSCTKSSLSRRGHTASAGRGCSSGSSTSTRSTARTAAGGSSGSSRRDEMRAISGSHAVLTNIVLAWNTARMQEVVGRLKRDGIQVGDEWLRRVGPAHFPHSNFPGTVGFGVEKFAGALIQCVPGQANRMAPRQGARCHARKRRHAVSGESRQPLSTRSSTRSNQAWHPRRVIQPTRPSPASSIAQLCASGTGAAKP